jgi:hypothetical protein
MRSSFAKIGIYAKGFFIGGIVEPAKQAFQYLLGLMTAQTKVYSALFKGDLKGAADAFTDALTGKNVDKSTGFLKMFDELEAESKRSAETIKAISEKAINDAVNGAQAKVDLEKKAIEQIAIARAKNLELEKKEEEDRVKLAADRAKKLEELKKEEAEAINKIEENARDAQKQAWERQLQDAEEVAKKTVAQFIADKGEEADFAKGRKQEERNAARLIGLTAGGGKLSKKDQEWLDAFNAVKIAGDVAGVAKKNLLEIENTKQTKVLEGIQKLLNDNLAEQRKLSTGG